MSRLIDTAPERIFLCVSDDLADINRPFPEVYPEDEPITWATNWTVAASVCYVREDMHNEAMAVLQARAERAEADLAVARKLLMEVRACASDWNVPQTLDTQIDAALAGKAAT